MSDNVQRFINILGKDYLTEQDAAFYACVSYSQFREHARDHGLLPFSFMGRRLYRKADVQRAIETAAQIGRPPSYGRRPARTWNRPPTPRPK